MAVELGNKSSITRAELFALVWQHDVKALAAKFGFSGPYLHRICTRWEIPKPGLGEWQKIAAGKKVRQQVLPEVHAGDPEVLRRASTGWSGQVPYKDRKRPPKSDELRALIERLKAQEAARQSSGRVTSERRALESKADDASPSIYLKMKIDRWTAKYGFRIAALDEDQAFHETLKILLRCSISDPTKLRGREAAVFLDFSRVLSGEVSDLARGRRYVGDIWNYRKDGLVHLPHDSAASVLEFLSSGRARYVELALAPIDRASDRIKNFDLSADLDPDG